MADGHSETTKTLRENVIALRAGGALRDVADPVAAGEVVEEVTMREPDGLGILRHTIAAQALGRAVRELYPGSRLAIGPIVEDGFYYDVDVPEPISSDDLPRIEEKMREIIAEGRTLRKRWVPRGEAIELFRARDELFKVEILEADSSPEFSVYEQEGSDFVDLCRGPHLPSMSRISPGSFALTRVSGAYWRGDSNRPMLTRIYGTAWATPKDLRVYLNRLEEARRRDHRLLAAKLDLFHFSEVSPGQVYWHPAGWTMVQELTGLIREKLARYGYQEVNTPRMVSRQLYEKSGHWGKFGTENMFTTDAYGDTFALKPMNCPSHVMLYNHAQHSYRDLPIRFAEFGNCYRRELSGTLHGLMRVTSMTQDDAHVFCTLDQVKDEIVLLNSMIDDIYRTLGFGSYYVRFADRPEQRVGSDEIWDRAEAALRDACAAAGVETRLNPGEGAFYGPKLEYVLTDSLGREWQCGTIQLDFNTPERLGANYMTADGVKEHPVMIHRAIIGTIERFLGIFLEQHATWLPLWISPTQIVFSPISEAQAEHAHELAQRFTGAGIRAAADQNHGDRIAQRILTHSEARVPLIAVIGDREIADGTATVRVLGQKNRVTLSVDELLHRLTTHITDRVADPAGLTA